MANLAFKDDTGQFFAVNANNDEPQLDSRAQEGQESEDELIKFLSEWDSESLEHEFAADLEFEPGLNPLLDICNSSKAIDPVFSSDVSPLPARNQRKKRSPHGSKTDSGLRRFSRKIFEKVKQKGNTSFDEIAEEMYRELEMGDDEEDATINKECTRKNIKRRVYDVLNVLVSMEMIAKDKREVTWVGFPSGVMDEELEMQQEKIKLEDCIKQRTTELQKMIIEQIAYKNLIRAKTTSAPSAESNAINLPFIAVRTSKNTIISHNTSKDELDHVFNFSQPFEILDNMEVLIRMGMAFGLERNMCSENNLEISKTMVSKELEPYLVDMKKSGAMKPNQRKM